MIRIPVIIGMLFLLSFPARACEREIREGWHQKEMAELRALMNAPTKKPVPMFEAVSEQEWMDLLARVERLEEAVMMQQIERNTLRIEALTRSALEGKGIFLIQQEEIK